MLLTNFLKKFLIVFSFLTEKLLSFKISPIFREWDRRLRGHVLWWIIVDLTPWNQKMKQRQAIVKNELKYITCGGAVNMANGDKPPPLLPPPPPCSTSNVSPARSSEKDLISSLSPNKLESKVMGPGLNPPPEGHSPFPPPTIHNLIDYLWQTKAKWMKMN